MDQTAVLGIEFIVGIVLARLLTPNQYGLVAMVTIFIAISRSFVNSGFTQALIRKNDAKQIDYSTVFYFNIAVSGFLYLIFFIFASSISNFYAEPKLTIIIRVMALGLIFDAFSIIQRARLTKRIDFKLQTKISITASVISGIVGILMAYLGFGVWALVTKMLLRQFINSLLLWLWNRWIPTWEFSIASFKEMFSFGSKLLISGLIDTIYRNVYKLIIGKFFSAEQLGYYTRAEQFRNLPSQNLTGAIQRVTYPVLASIQDDLPKLKKAYRKIIKSIMLITFTLMLGLAATAKPLLLTLIGENWLQSVIYLQLLCFAGMLYPLHAINLNMLKVQGRSDLFLKLEIIKKILAVPVIMLGIFLGIKEMIIGMIVNSFIAYFLNSYYSGRMIKYSSFAQLKDIIPSFLLALFISLILYMESLLISTTNLIILIIQIFTGILMFLGLSEILKMKDYLYLKNVVIEKYKEINAKRKN
jgi:O-antigen/teichoic acid export membrane protein